MIKVNHITKSFMTSKGRHYLFKDLNLVIEDKQSVGLLGRNGAGKSTLLRIICGLDKPDNRLRFSLSIESNVWHINMQISLPLLQGL